MPTQNEPRVGNVFADASLSSETACVYYVLVACGYNIGTANLCACRVVQSVADQIGKSKLKGLKIGAAKAPKKEGADIASHSVSASIKTKLASTYGLQLVRLCQLVDQLKAENLVASRRVELDEHLEELVLSYEKDASAFVWFSMRNEEYEAARKAWKDAQHGLLAAMDAASEATFSKIPTSQPA